MLKKKKKKKSENIFETSDCLFYPYELERWKAVLCLRLTSAYQVNEALISYYGKLNGCHSASKSCTAPSDLIWASTP